MAPISEPPTPQVPEVGFSVLHQKVELDIDLPNRRLRGRTEITLGPHSKELKSVRLHCRQCEIKRVTVNGKACSGMEYQDPYQRAVLQPTSGVQQYHLLQQRIEGQLKRPPERELTVSFPKNLKIDDLDPFSEEAQSMFLSKSVGSSKGDGSANALDSASINRATTDYAARFTPVQLNIDYAVNDIRDGLQFVGWEEEDFRYPHVYTTNSSSPGVACCLFPCVDEFSARCTWEMSIKCQKTVGDAFGISKSPLQANGVNGVSNHVNGVHPSAHSSSKYRSLSEDDKALDLVVIGTGDMTDEVRVTTAKLAIS